MLTPAEKADIENDLASLEQTFDGSARRRHRQVVARLSDRRLWRRLGRKWGIGQKGKDNGILLIVAPNDHKVRIEVGRRLEPFMTDRCRPLIIQNAILPKFRRGDFAGGIEDGISRYQNGASR